MRRPLYSSYLIYYKYDVLYIIMYSVDSDAESSSVGGLNG